MSKHLKILGQYSARMAAGDYDPMEIVARLLPITPLLENLDGTIKKWEWNLTGRRADDT
jgi:hypothetical protein